MNEIKECQKWLEKVLEEGGFTDGDYSAVFEFSSEISKGDFTSMDILKLAKKHNKSPLDIYKEIENTLENAKPKCVESIDFIMPGFLNVYIKAEYIINSIEDTKKFKHEIPEKWIIEHTSPNTNKPLHVGHVRNNIIGESLISFLKNIRGDEVISDCINNDRGISIARAMWGYLKFQKKNSEVWNGDSEYWFNHPSEWNSPEDKNVKPDHFVGECYIAGSSDCKEFPESEISVRDMVIAWEAGDSIQRELWKKMLAWYYEGRNETLKDLGSHFDNEWNESDHYELGKDYVKKGVEMGILKTLDNGGILTDLEEKYGLSDTIVQKNDGTSLYITQDFALTDLKKKKWNADNFVWIVGPEQSLQFKQMFAVCEQLGIGTRDQFFHLPYGYVGLKTSEGFKKMASREGNVILADDLLSLVKSNVTDKFNASEKREVYNDDHIKIIALAAIKFAILKVARPLDMAFDIDESISISGNSGPYILYTYARTDISLSGNSLQSLDPAI